ncbi:hypothetical protein [Rhodococcus tibetensis]|uniref:Uncharacterized protein n=1 Tax=Rhodococcus tibetensis TaxID=2965064 RepID=A0ABT1QC74_9NOCA|nr:hypothetical protein [Rhodococcus sp. FXJ9.536]MCQ4118720.1 hypothetical protein [Rhodococcus sp. FXJ9.536]
MSTTYVDGFGEIDSTGYDAGVKILAATPCPTWCIKPAGHTDPLDVAGVPGASECASRLHTAYRWKADEEFGADEVAVEALEYAYLDGTVMLDAAEMYAHIKDVPDAHEAEGFAAHLIAAAAALRSTRNDG